MRKTPTAVLLGLLVPALSALPVVTAPRAEAKPVAPVVHTAALRGVDADALRGRAGDRSRAVARRSWSASAAPTRPAVLTSKRHTATFDLLGVTWRTGRPPTGLTVVVRTHGNKGWSGWTALELLDTPPTTDKNTAAGRAGTEPLWVGASDGYQVRVDLVGLAGDAAGATGATLPRGLRVDLVNPGDSAADGAVGAAAPPARAAAASAQPPINSRASWGADERLRGSSPNYSTTIKAGFVHHTAGTNKYSESDVPKIIRGIYAYHTKSNGWSDIGYNFLVDRFGRLWEGRYGGITRPVLGAHTGGFNVDSFAVSALGNYDKATPTPEMVDSIARLLAWKLTLSFRSPDGTTTLTSLGGGTSRYPAGRRVSFNVISGHRDAGNTSCPGANLYAELDNIRALTRSYMGAGLVNPATSTDQPAYGSPQLAISARTLQDQQWALEVRNPYDGSLLRAQTGSASPGAPAAATWDLRDQSGVQVRPGPYDVSLASSSATGPALTWTHPVTVVPPPGNPATAPAVALPGASGFVPLDPARIYDTRTEGRLPLGPGQRVDLAVAGSGGVPATGVAAVALTVTASMPSQSTSVSVWPAGGAKTRAAMLNLPTGTTRSALAVSALGGNGLVSLSNRSGVAEVAVDVAGYYPASDPSTGAVSGDLLHPVKPFRLFDSRKDSSGRLAKGESRTLTMPALGGVPADQMSGAVVNVTSVGATGAGNLVVHQPGSGLTEATSLSYASGPAMGSRVVTALSDGQLKVNNRGAGTHVVVDVVGWYASSALAGGKTFRALTPRRVLNTSSGFGVRKGRVGRHGSITVKLAGKGRALPARTTAVVINLTSRAATSSTSVTAWAAGLKRPTATDLSVARGRTTANLVLVRLGTGKKKNKGRLTLYNSKGATHLVADLVGYYR